MATNIESQIPAAAEEQEFYTPEDVRETALEYGKVVLLSGEMVDVGLVRYAASPAIANA